MEFILLPMILKKTVAFSQLLCLTVADASIRNFFVAGVGGDY